MFWRKFCDRNERLILTLISKQWLVFFIGTTLLIRNYITAEVWVMLAGVVIGANVFQKVKVESREVREVRHSHVATDSD